MKKPEPNENDGVFGNVKFDVEHALNIYALSYCTFAAPFIYNSKFLKTMAEITHSCHIYIIGYVPNINLIRVDKERETLFMTMQLEGEYYKLSWNIPSSYALKKYEESYYLEDENGIKRWIDEKDILLKLNVACGGNPFEVKYIGQAYGKDGSRNAIDRLLKHETLQKIAIKGVPEGYTLQVILLEIQTDNRVFTVFNPNAENGDDGGLRRKNGLDKLFETTDAERVSLFEAALIRHFSPEFNREFKNSFPSTNLKILQDCYAKDFLALVSEICIDEFPYYLWSESVEASLYHIVTHDLQKDSKRKAFFVMNEENND